MPTHNLEASGRASAARRVGEEIPRDVDCGLEGWSGCFRVPGGIPRTLGQIRSGITRGQDKADRVWAVCRSTPETAWRGKTGDLHVSGLHALLREAEKQWSLHRLAQDG